MTTPVEEGLAAGALPDDLAAAGVGAGAEVPGVEAPGVAESFRPARRFALFSLSVSHCAADLTQSSISALVPFLVVHRGYSYAAAGAFVLAASIGGAILQPIAGHYGDRSGARWLLPIGLVITGLGVGMVGELNQYLLALLAVALGSVGFSVCHPEGARYARVAAGTRLVTGMSYYSVGGSVGYALGPLLVAAFVGSFGLGGTILLAVLPAVAAVLVAGQLFRLPAPPRHTQHTRALAGLREEWNAYSRLIGYIALQSGAVTGLMLFVPLLLVSRHGISPGRADGMTSILLVSAAVGTLIGGRLADRYGRRLVLIFPMAVLAPLMVIVPSLGYAPMVPLIAAIGLLTNFSMSTGLVVCQEYLPGRIGLATGLLVGVSVAAGGLASLLFGFLGDAAGPGTVLYVSAVLPLLAAILATSLPRPAASTPGEIWSLRDAHS